MHIPQNIEQWKNRNIGIGYRLLKNGTSNIPKLELNIWFGFIIKI